MAQEFSIAIGIDAALATQGARVYKRATDDVGKQSTKMDKRLQRSRKEFAKLQRAATNFKGAVTGIFAGFTVAAAVRQISQFQTAMSQVNALIGDRGTKAELMALEEAARQMGATTIFSAQEAAQGLKFLTLAGFEAKESVQALKPALDLAAAGALGLAESADIVSNIMSAFKIEASETARAADALALTASRSNTDIRQLGEAMKFVAPVAANVGVSVEQTSAAIGILGNAGLQASLAGTSLRKVMSSLVSPSSEAQEALASMGLTAGELSAMMSDPAKGLPAVIKTLADANIDAAKAFEIFGLRGGPAVLALTSQTGDLETLTNALDNAGGAAERMADIMADNLAGDAKAAFSALQELTLQVGDAGLSGALRTGLNSITGFLRGLGGLSAEGEVLDKTLREQADSSKKFEEAMADANKIGLLFRENMDLITAALKAAAVVMVGRWVYVLGAGITATTGFQAAVSAATIGLGKLTFGMVGAGAATAALTSRLLIAGKALLLSPWGIAITAIGALTFAFMDTAEATETAETNFESIKVPIDELASSLDTLTEAQKNYQAQIRQLEINDQLTALQQLQTQLNASKQAMEDLQTEAALEGMGAGQLSQEEEMGLAARILPPEEVLRLQSEIDTINQSLQSLGSEMSILGAQAEGVDLAEKLNLGPETVDSIEAAGKSFTTLQERVQPNIAATDELQSNLGFLQQVMERVQSATKDGKKAFEQAGITIESLTSLMHSLVEEYDDTYGNAKKVAAAEKELSSFRKTALRTIDPLKAASEEYAAILKMIKANATEAGLSQEQLADYMDIAKRQFEENVKTIKQQSAEAAREADPLAKAWENAVQRIDDAWFDFIRSGFEGFDSFKDGIVDLAKNLMAELIATFSKQIAFNFLASAGVNVASLFPSLAASAGLAGAGGAAASAAGAGALTSGAGSLGGSLLAGSALGGLGSAFIGGAQGFLGGATGQAAFTQGSFVSTGTGLAGAAGNVLAGAGVGALSGAIADKIFGSRGKNNAAFSAIGGGIGAFFGGPIGALIGGAAGSFVSNLFGGAKETTAAGLDLTLTGGQLGVNEFERTKKKKSFFRGSKRRTTIRAADPELTASLQQVLDSAFDPIKEIAKQLSPGDVDLLSPTRETQRIDLLGKSEEEAQSIIQNFLQDVINDSIQNFVDNASGLSIGLRRVLNEYRNDVENFTTVFALAGSIQSQINEEMTPTEIAEEAIEEEGKTLLEQYKDQLETFQELVGLIPGVTQELNLLGLEAVALSEEEIGKLTAALSENKGEANLFSASLGSIATAFGNIKEIDPPDFNTLDLSGFKLDASAITSIAEGFKGDFAAAFAGTSNFAGIDLSPVISAITSLGVQSPSASAGLGQVLAQLEAVTTGAPLSSAELALVAAALQGLDPEGIGKFSIDQVKDALTALSPASTAAYGDIGELKNTLDAFDADGDGRLTLTQIKDGIAALNDGGSAALQIDAIVTELGVLNRTGQEFTLDDVITAINNIDPSSAAAALQDIQTKIAALDADGSGKLSLQKIQEELAGLDPATVEKLTEKLGDMSEAADGFTVDQVNSALSSLALEGGLAGVSITDVREKLSRMSDGMSELQLQVAGVTTASGGSITSLQGVIGSFDGSVESLAALDQALGAVRQSQVQLAAQYLITRDNSLAALQGAQTFIQESQMSNEQLYRLRKAQADELLQQLQLASDPTRIQELSQEISKLSVEAFNLAKTTDEFKALSEEEQVSFLREVGDNLIGTLEQTEELVVERTNAGLNQVESDAQLVIDTAAELLEQGARSIADAADDLARAADRFVGAANTTAGAAQQTANAANTIARNNREFINSQGQLVRVIERYNEGTFGKIVISVDGKEQTINANFDGV